MRVIGRAYVLRAPRWLLAWLCVMLVTVPTYSQVLPVVEIKDAGARNLQEHYMYELKSVGADVQAHRFPYPFYFSRLLDIDEKQQRQVEQRSIHFDKFNGKTVLEITGNYYAAYSDIVMDKRARVKNAYEDVVLPILKLAVPRFPPDDSFVAFAIEVSYHVRRKTFGVMVENPENVTFVLPRAAAHHLVTAADVEHAQAALLESEVYVDAEPFSLWLNNDPRPEVARKVSAKPQPVATSMKDMAGEENSSSAEATVAPALLKASSLPVRLITPDTISTLKLRYADAIGRMLNALKDQAHFVAYAPPSFVGFHQNAYLQLSITTPLSSGSGSRYQLAALAFDEHIAGLVRPVLAFFQQDGDFDGISFSTVLKQPDGNKSEAVEFFFPFSSLRCFANYDCTGQHLIDTGIVLINGERAALNLQTAEASDSR